jgi:plastocyanin
VRRFTIACALLLATACSGGSDDAGGGVAMTSAQVFDPDTITVSAGATVTWDNASSEQHTVTADEGALPDGADYFASGGASTEAEANDDLSAGFVGPGESYSHTFQTPGTYRYYCIPHEEAGMRGTVIVEG